MKKVLSLSLILILALAMVFASNMALAVKVGDVVGYAQPTDIVATINGHMLESYNVDGHTYICVEDLRYYGFDVSYDEETRSLSFNRNYDVKHLAPQYSNPNFALIGSLKEKKEILHTDIITYANGVAVPAANINGQTIIKFDALAAFGDVSYNDNRREISLLMYDVIYDVLASFALDYQQNFDDNEDWKVIIRAKGHTLLFTCTSHTYMDNAQVADYKEKTFQEDVIFADSLLSSLVENDYPATEVHLEMKNSDGSVIATYTAK